MKGILAVLAALLIGIIGFEWLSEKETTQPSSVVIQRALSEVSVSTSQDVVLYATAWCGYCKKTRELLKREGIAYTEYDIEKSATAHKRYKKLGGRGVPFMVIHGTVVSGYDPNRIVALAKR